MAEYITKEQVIEWFRCYAHEDRPIRFEDLEFDIQHMIPEDVSPVRNGRWIPVTERMPDLIPCIAGTVYSETVLILTSCKKVMTAVWNGVDWIAPFDFWEAWDDEVTHWIPLPELPKEVK